MLTLFTAVGHLTMQKTEYGKRLPIVRVNKKEYAVAPRELILWSGLAFQILTKEELLRFYQVGIKHQNLPGDPDFDYILRRLLIRGLVVNGTGCTAVDALYHLLGQLHIAPVNEAFHVRLFACIKLWLSGRLPFYRIPHYLKRPENTPIEALILKLAQHLSFSVAELIGFVDPSSLPGVPDLIGLPDSPDAQRLTNPERPEDIEQTVLDHVQYPVLEGIANLYLKKQIIFQK